MKFEEMNIKPEIVKALAEMGITEPTSIQEKSIPLAKAGKDVIGMSKTGSGKTLAFGAPILEKIVPNQGIQALIMAPTRELAVQISNEMQKFGKYLKFKITTIFGGVSLDPQADALQRADIVVGTPGRLLDHLNRGNLNLTKVKFAVLDEADKMVEMGFIEDVREILNYTPLDRQMLLFGATLSEEVNHLKANYMKNPEIAKAELQVEEDFLEQFYYNTQPQEKFSLLVHLLKTEQIRRVLIFCSARSTVELLTRNLRKQRLEVEMIHGKLNQPKRLRIIENFNKGIPQILVASTVAARGLDIKDVSHVFNYDLSQDPQEYIHRIGRTARAGDIGKAITLLCPRDYEAFGIIEKRFPVSIKKLEKPEFPKVFFQARERGSFGNFARGRGFSRGGFGGGQSSDNSRRPSWNNSGNFGGDSENRGFGRSRGFNRGQGFGQRSNSWNNSSRPSQGFSRGPRQFGTKPAGAQRNSTFGRNNSFRPKRAEGN